MPDKVNKRSGRTSTFIPGGVGDDGNRGAVTFFGSYDGGIGDKNISFILNDETVTIKNAYDIQPILYDYIVYAEENTTYLLYISGEFNEEEEIYPVRLIDSWDTQNKFRNNSLVSDMSSISINVSCVAVDNIYYNGFKTSLVNGEVTPYGTDGLKKATVTTSNEIMNVYTSCLFRFNVVSKNNLTIGNYKIQIEFTTDLQSPGMDSIIAKRFKSPADYSGLGARYGRTDEKMTFMGYVSNYSCNGCEIDEELNTVYNPTFTSFNFDDEKLDNFSITVKDYNAGVGSKSYASDVYIPKMIIRNAIYAGCAYKCDVYIYIQNTNGTIEKAWLGDITTDIWDGIRNSDETVHDEYVPQIVKPEQPDLPPEIPDAPVLPNYEPKRYPGSDDKTINLNAPQGSYAEVQVYVENIHLGTTVSEQDYAEAGDGGWCHAHLFQNTETGEKYIRYVAQMLNDTGVKRSAVFTHYTTDSSISYGINSGKPALERWNVTVYQKSKQGKDTPIETEEDTEIKSADDILAKDDRVDTTQIINQNGDVIDIRNVDDMMNDLAHEEINNWYKNGGTGTSGGLNKNGNKNLKKDDTTTGIK